MGVNRLTRYSGILGSVTRGGSVGSEANNAPAILTLPRQKKSAFEALTTSGSTMAMPPWLQVGAIPDVSSVFDTSVE